MEFTGIPVRIQMEWFIPVHVENFRKKGNTFRGISFFSLLLEFPEISVPFVHTCTSARLLAVILPRKNAKHLIDGGRFPKRLSLQCVSLPVGSVGGRFRTLLQPFRCKRIKFCCRYLFFSFASWFGLPACFRLSYIDGKLCGCWLLIFLTKCGCWSSQTDEIVSISS